MLGVTGGGAGGGAAAGGHVVIDTAAPGAEGVPLHKMIKAVAPKGGRGERGGGEGDGGDERRGT
jgi:hypothetical protein